MEASYQGNLKIAMEYSIDLLVTSNDLKIEENKLRLHVFQMKASNSGNLKFFMEYIFDLKVTFTDL